MIGQINRASIYIYIYIYLFNIYSTCTNNHIGKMKGNPPKKCTSMYFTCSLFKSYSSRRKKLTYMECQNVENYRHHQQPSLSSSSNL